MRWRAIGLAVGVAFLPTASWCAESGAESTGGSWVSLIFYVINFALFIALIGWANRRFGRPAQGFFSSRARSIKETLARAEAACRDAEKLARQSAERMASLDDDKRKLRADIDAETAYIVSRIRQMGRESAERIKHDSELTAAAMAEAAHRRVREALAEATGRLARDLLVRNFTSNDQARLLQGFQDKLSQEAGQ
jgi:F0F1-type ATP synthase membrane subunit b/b'